MSKTAVVYWSGTGNTAAMADAIVDGVKSVGGQVEAFTADSFNSDMAEKYDYIAFGCPSMGCEQLEDTEFEPMFDSCKSKLKGKKIALFVRTAGATVNGCKLGRTTANLSVQIWFATA